VPASGARTGGGTLEEQGAAAYASIWAAQLAGTVQLGADWTARAALAWHCYQKVNPDGSVFMTADNAGDLDWRAWTMS